MRFMDCALALVIASAAHAGLLSLAFDHRMGTTQLAAEGSIEVPLTLDISLDDGEGVSAAASKAQPREQPADEDYEQVSEETPNETLASALVPDSAEKEMKPKLQEPVVQTPEPQETVVQTPEPQQPAVEATASIQPVAAPPKLQTEKKDASLRKQKTTSSKSSKPSKPSKSSTGGTSKQQAGAPSQRAVRSYALKLRRWVDRHKLYPSDARLKRQQGSVRLWVKINRKGAVLASRVTRKSGNAQLDSATASLARRASPFPRIPSEFGRSTYTFSVTLRYSLN